MRRAVAAAIGIAVAWTPVAAHAYRPFDGTDADVAEAGEFELELGPAHFYGQGPHHYVIAPATVLNLGLVPRLELVVDAKQFFALLFIHNQIHQFSPVWGDKICFRHCFSVSFKT